jgi:hypothetical protein
VSRTLVVIAAFLALSLPAALAAPPEDKGKPEKPAKAEKAAKVEKPGKAKKSVSAPGQSAEKNAAKACKAERGTTADSIAAFKNKYGTNANKANAFGKCVSGKSKEAEGETESESSAAEENAAKKCKAERGTTAESIAAFKNKYGTNANKANAFGKCVSKLAKEK